MPIDLNMPTKYFPLATSLQPVAGISLRLIGYQNNNAVSLSLTDSRPFVIQAGSLSNHGNAAKTSLTKQIRARFQTSLLLFHFI